MGRPKNIHNTVAKTYMLYEDDVNELNKLRQSAKQVFHMGIVACQDERIVSKHENLLDDLSGQLGVQDHMLKVYAEKQDLMAQIIFENLGIDLIPKKINKEELTRILEERRKQRNREV